LTNVYAEYHFRLRNVINVIYAIGFVINMFLGLELAVMAQMSLITLNALIKVMELSQYVSTFLWLLMRIMITFGLFLKMN
jgi:uncharacterized membrane protein YciS (DUF1049 family)